MNMHSPVSAGRPVGSQRANTKRVDIAAPANRDLAYWKARTNAEVDSEHEEAVVAACDFPALHPLIDAWLPLRRADAELDAIHADLEERRLGDREEIEPARRRWHEAMDATREAVKAVLSVPVADARELLAKVQTYCALAGRHDVELENGDGASNALVQALMADIAAQASASEAAADEQVRVASAWNAAKAKAHAALAALKSASDEEADRRLDELYDAQERWEALTPPTIEALTEVMAFSLTNSGPLHWSFQSAHCPNSMRDLLDSGSPEDVIAGRVYLHLLRMAGSKSPATMTPPIAGLFPAFDPKDDDLVTAWKAHHRQAEPHSARISEFAHWEAPGRSAYRDSDGTLQALQHWVCAMHTHARAEIEAYEATGRSLTVTRKNGEAWLGATLPRDGSAPPSELGRLTVGHDALRKVVAAEVEKRAALRAGA
jgi:hypothetical protein